MQRRGGLGRGLGALIPTHAPEPVPAADSTPPRGDTHAPEPVPAADRAPARGVDRGRASLPEAAAQEATEPGMSGQGAAVTTKPAPAEDEADAPPRLVPVAGARYVELPIERVRPNARQPRQVFDDEELVELIHSVAEVGVLQPVVVRPDGHDRYELVMGERRWRAAQAAGLQVLPAIVRDTSDVDLLRDALLENLHRAQLNPLEEAAAYRQLLDDFDCSHEQLSARLGRSRPQISNTLRLLRLAPAVQRRVAAGVLSAGHARAIVALPDLASQERLAARVVAEGLSVRTTEEVVSAGGDAPPERATRRRGGPRSSMSPETEHRLAERLDTRVRVEAGRTRGRITIDFADVEDLARLVDLIDPPAV